MKNILFLTMNSFTDIDMHSIYSDLMKVFISHGHRPYIVTPREWRSGERTVLLNLLHYSILKVRIGNIQNVSFIEKGISTVLLEYQYKKAVIKHLGDIEFDLVLYSTPPITILSTIKTLKKRYGIRTYLMLKDIFPQNAVDLGLMKSNGLIYRYFRNKEKQLYQYSDIIGCMSPANIQYLLFHNSEISPSKVTLCPNAIIPRNLTMSENEKKRLRNHFGIPEEKCVFVYGGNLGKPQGIPFLIECLKVNIYNSNCFFVICGTGSEFSSLKKFVDAHNPDNLLLINGLDKQEYDLLVECCDIGLLFLDFRFTIPNFPSRMLTYMEYAMPIFACTDTSTDVGDIIVKGGFGWWCESKNVSRFSELVNIIRNSNYRQMGFIALEYLKHHYDAQDVYKTIVS